MLKQPVTWILGSFSPRRDAYERQLRADSALLIVPFTVALTLLVTISGYLWASYQAAVDISIPILFCLATVLTGYYCLDRIQSTEEVHVQQVGTLFIGTHFLLITAAFVDLWPLSSLLPYFFGFLIVLAAGMLFPEAGFYVWAISAVVMFGSVAVMGNMSWRVLSLLLPAALVNGSLATAVYFMTFDWVQAAISASRSHLLASHQRDELFAVKEKLQQANAELRGLYTQLGATVAVGHRVVSLLDLDALLEQVARLIQEQLGYGFIGIFLTDRVQGHLLLRACAGPTADQFTTVYPLALSDHHVISRAAATREPTFVRDILAAGYHSHPYKQLNSRAEAAFPLIVGDHLLGVLNVQTPTTAPFAPNDLDTLQVLADQVAIAIHNATIHHKLNLRHQLTAQMNEIGRAISSTIELDKVLTLVLEKLSTLVSSDQSSVILTRKHQMRIVAQKGVFQRIDNNILDVPINDPVNPFAEVIRSRKPLSISDADAYDGVRHLPGFVQTRSWLGVPLINNKRVVGMLSIAREHVRPFTADEIEVAAALAAQAGVALTNARLFNRTLRFKQQLEEEVKIRTGELLKAYDRLEQLDQAKADFIQVAAHELRTPITVLQGYGDMLLRDPDIQLNDHHRLLVDGVRTGVTRLVDVVNDMLDASRIENRTLTIYPEPVNPYVIIESIVRKLRPTLLERQLTIRLRPGLSEVGFIKADRDALQKIFYHLIINAIKYTPDGREIAVDGRVIDRSGKAVAHISVQDEGIGIDPAHHDLIFTKFYQTGEVALHSSGRTKFKGGGPGLGLAIVEGLVEAHHGRVWVESSKCDEERCPGSKFVVQLRISD